MHPLNVFLLLFLLLCSHRFTYARWLDIQFRVEPVIEIVRHVGEFEICPSLSYYSTHNWFTSLKLNLNANTYSFLCLKRYKHFNVTFQNRRSGKKISEEWHSNGYCWELRNYSDTRVVCLHFLLLYCPSRTWGMLALNISLSSVDLSIVSQSLLCHPSKQPC